MFKSLREKQATPRRVAVTGIRVGEATGGSPFGVVEGGGLFMFNSPTRGIRDGDGHRERRVSSRSRFEVRGGRWNSRGPEAESLK